MPQSSRPIGSARPDRERYKRSRAYVDTPTSCDGGSHRDERGRRYRDRGKREYPARDDLRVRKCKDRTTADHRVQERRTDSILFHFQAGAIDLMLRIICDAGCLGVSQTQQHIFDIQQTRDMSQSCSRLLNTMTQLDMVRSQNVGR